MAKPIMLFGYDLRSVNWYLVFYVVFCLAFVVGGITRLLPMGPKTIIFAVGSVLIFYFFYQRWFGSAGVMNTSWPPVINTCPDYLTYMPTLPGVATGGCIDMIGISNNGGLIPVNDTDMSSQSALTSNKVFPYTSTDVTGARDASSLNAICQQCAMMGLTWEGVYDGDSCMAASTLKARTAAGSGNCPV